MGASDEEGGFSIPRPSSELVTQIVLGGIMAIAAWCFFTAWVLSWIFGSGGE